MAKGSKFREESSDEEEAEREESGEEVEEDNDDEEEEEEEGLNEYEKDGFIVDDEEEEGGSDEEKEDSEEEAKKKKKKKKKKRPLELEEEDYALLEENVGGFHPRPQKVEKFKRLKKATSAGGEDDRRFLEDDDEGDGHRVNKSSNAEELKHQLFGDDEDLPDDLRDEEERRPEEEEDDENEDYEDEMGDFIVEGEDEYDEEGHRVRRPKKSKPRQGADGISTEALADIMDIFGDPVEMVERFRSSRAGEDRMADEYEEDEEGVRHHKEKKKLEQQFEPTILEQKYMTPRDEIIRHEDLPERYQLMLEETGGVLEDWDIDYEAEWIYERVFSRSAWEEIQGGHEYLTVRDPFDHIRIPQKKKDVVEEIKNVLWRIHKENLEVPFIGMYRKDLCETLVREPDMELEENRPSPKDGATRMYRYQALWAVQLWDKKYLKMQRRKGALLHSYQAQLKDLSDEEQEIFRRIMHLGENATSEQMLDDVDVKFRLQFPDEEIDPLNMEDEELEAQKPKRPVKRSLYHMYRKAGLSALVRRFCLAPEKVGENLQRMYKDQEPEDERTVAEEMATGYMSSSFVDEQAVLKGARYMAAVELSSEPLVREHVRREYVSKYLMVTTAPTADGMSAIDKYHRYAEVKWLRNKPASAFGDAQWLLVERAEAEGLLEVTFGLPLDRMEDIMNDFRMAYLSDGVSKFAQEWNSQRLMILEDSVNKHLLPSLYKEMRKVLSSRARRAVVQGCEDFIWRLASVAPWDDFEKDAADEEQGDAPLAPRVLACCWSAGMNGRPPTTFVVIDSEGELVDYLQTAHLLGRGGAEAERRKKEDVERLLNFIMQHKPHIAVLGGSELRCKRLKEECYEVVFKLAEENPKELAFGIDTININFGDETVPRLYEASSISEAQLPGQPGIIRRAVMLGRYLQDPLKALATLCGPSRDILTLPMDKNQDLLDKDELYSAVERTLVTVTNQVGVDINLAAMHQWHFAPLQFVAGLGPRKSTHVERTVCAAGHVDARKDLMITLKAMSRKVFINAMGAIRVRATGSASRSENLDPLDDTRIHPESYEVARTMAGDAYKAELEQAGKRFDSNMLDFAVEHVRESPSYLKRIRIDVFAKTWFQEKQKSVSRDTLMLIQEELEEGFREWRAKYTPPTPQEEFYLLSGETPDTLALGKLVQATVRRIQQHRVICFLDSGLVAVVDKENLSDDHDFDHTKRLHEGVMLTGRIKEVNVNEFRVELLCRGTQLRGQSNDLPQPAYERSQYYMVDDDRMMREEEKERAKMMESRKKALHKRMIVHPCFQNISSADAVEQLLYKDVGAYVMRPSSRGPMHLSLTIKLKDGLCMHVDIAEEGKDPSDVTSFMRLGKPLRIAGQPFEDLDEVVANYVEPVVTFLKEMLSYRKFREEPTEEVDRQLVLEKEADRNRIPYYISLDYKHPGVFVLSYIGNRTVHHEYITLTPKGYRYHKQEYNSADKLIRAFQQNYQRRDRAPPLLHAQQRYPQYSHQPQQQLPPPPPRPPQAQQMYTQMSGW